MKKCPQCNRTYADDTLSFCLEDGALLSASYNPQEIPPTVAINALEVPTVASYGQEMPTVVAERQIPTVAFEPRVTEQIEKKGVRWYIYLLGLFISWLIYFTLHDFLYVAIGTPVFNLFGDSLKNLSDNSAVTSYLANLIYKIPFNLVFFGIIAMILGFVRSGAKWRWGLIVGFLQTYRTALYIYYFLAPAYILVEIVIYLVTIFFACICSYLGSILSRLIFKKNAGIN
jgi:hypothetical protein